MRIVARVGAIFVCASFALTSASVVSAQTVISSSPTAMKSSQQGGVDSTVQTSVAAPTSKPSTVNVPWNYKVYCTPGSVTNNTTGTCPSGQTYNAVGNGSTTFNQTYTVTTSCPRGQYASGTTSSSAPTPSPGAVCGTPVVTCNPSSYNNYQNANCPSGYTTLNGSSTFQQTQTVTTSCPGGSYGSPSTAWGGWSPNSDTNTCPKPIAQSYVKGQLQVYCYFGMGSSGNGIAASQPITSTASGCTQSGTFVNQKSPFGWTAQFVAYYNGALIDPSQWEQSWSGACTYQYSGFCAGASHSGSGLSASSSDTAYLTLTWKATGEQVSFSINATMNMAGGTSASGGGGVRPPTQVQ